MSWGVWWTLLPSSGPWTITTFIPAQISRSRAETRLDHLNKIAPKVWGNWRKCLVYSERATEKKEESTPDTTCDRGPVSLMWQDGPLWKDNVTFEVREREMGTCVYFYSLISVSLITHAREKAHFPFFTSNTALRGRSGNQFCTTRKLVLLKHLDLLPPVPAEPRCPSPAGPKNSPCVRRLALKPMGITLIPRGCSH